MNSRVEPYTVDPVADRQSAAKHTPGPWATVRGHTGDILVVAVEGDDEQENIAEVYAGPTAEADARLIAAAPELLAALTEAERFLAYWAGETETFIGPGTPKSCLAMIRAAKARSGDGSPPPANTRDGSTPQIPNEGAEHG